MDALERVDPGAPDVDAPPLLAGLTAVESAVSLWARLDAAVTRGLVSGRQLSPLQAFRDMLLEVTAAAAEKPVSTMLGLLLDRSGYLRELREERSEEADGRIENLMELVSAAREYEAGDPDAGLAGLRRSAGAAVRRRQAGGQSIGQGAADDAALGQGPRVPGGGDRRPRGGPVPAFAGLGRRGRARGGTAAVLRRHHPGAHASCISRAPPGGGSSASTRAPSRRGSSTRFRRSCCGTKSRAAEAAARRPRAAGATRPIRTGTRRRPAAASYAPEDEDQSGRGGLRTGGKVRHPMFGVGTVRVGRRAGRRRQGRRPVRLGRPEDPARQVRELELA